MGKKGKKKGSEGGPSQGPPEQQQQQRPPQQQPQQQQRPPQQQPQQQQRPPQQQPQQQQRPPQQQPQQQQRPPQQQPQQQQRPPQQQQAWQPQPGAAAVAQVTGGVAQLNVGDTGRQQPGPGRGRGGRGPQQPAAAWGQQAQAQIPGMPGPPQQGRGGRGPQQPAAAWGQQAQAQIPGMPGPPQQGRGGRGPQQPAAAWGQQAQAQIPGMPGPPQQGRGERRPQQGGAPPGQQAQAPIPGMARAPVPGMAQAPQQGHGRGGDDRGPRGREREPSVAGSTASSAAGDTASVRSGGSGGKGPGPKPAAQAGPGTSPVKTTLSATLQATYYNQIPKRKVPSCGGKEGRPITVETNMIPIIFKPNFARVVCHYDVKLDPDKPRFMYRAVVEAVRIKHFRNLYPAFDGRCNLFAAGSLPFGDSLTTEIEVLNNERQKTMTFKVTLTKAQDIDMSWLPNVKPGFAENEKSQIAIQALDVILRASSIRQNRITVGRSFFSPPAGRVVELGNGMDLWVGTFQSAVLGWKPYFNIDVAHKAFPRSQRVIDLFQELCGDSRSNKPVTARDIEYGRSKLSSFLRGLKVTYEIPGQPSSRRTMGINDLGRNAETANFELDNGEVTTVKNYFARVKKYNIKHPDLPTLWVGSRNKLILIPAELCVIEPGQVTQKKMDERQTSTMIKYAATDAQTRKRKIMEGFAKMRTNEDPASKEFGIAVGGGFETVKARVLNPPMLKGKANNPIRKGVWRANGFFTAMTLPDKSWTILNLNDRTQETPLRYMVKCLMDGGRAVGMDIGEPLTPFKNLRAPMRDVREILQFFNEKKEEGLRLIIVVVPDKTGPVYGKVKQVAELNVGVLTQCIKAVTVERKMNDATAGNILLKINSKLNGTNQIITGKRPQCLAEPCMIVGADVTHPSPDAVGIPSIAAVAASHEPNAFRYNIKIQLQPPKTEIILNLEQIMKDQLLFFYRTSKQKPGRIIFYRDGVSEGQFPQVMHHELQAIRNACRKLAGSTPYEPKITFLVVQKRHHIRLFPTDPQNSDDRNGNVQAGTVVDTEITHPSHIDFYLVSHASIQGTARPTKYRCLWDDSDMSEDEIEQLTYYLCHMFARCTRSVSYPAPTYYAHLAAFRARALINEVDIRLNNLEEEQRMKMTIKDDIIMKNPMFFV